MSDYSKTILASYATFKELYNSQKYRSPYQILSEFIRYIIASQHLFTFTSTDIQGYLNDEFGFNLPLAVIRTSLHNLEGLVCDHRVYKVNQKEFLASTDFQTTQKKSEEQKTRIVKAIASFGINKNIELDENKIEKELFAFILDEKGDEKYQKIIGEFVLANKDKSEIANAVSTIQEGGILYTGLSYNIADFGSLKTPITLFLDTEILFDIVGLNGEVYGALAADFLNLVNAANRSCRLITLCYFPEVEDDINHYFKYAERIVDGRSGVSLTYAIQSIVSGCSGISDIAEKKTDFFNTLTGFGIKKDDKNNYYDSAEHIYNIEERNVSGFSSDDPANAEGMRFCSHINVLRKGEKSVDYFSSKYLFITDTRRVLDISEALRRTEPSTGDLYCNYAISLSHITNLLWYKMNRGFGATEFPCNLNAVIKAQVILSGYVSQGITTTYNEIKEKVAKGELNQEQAASYIVALKWKKVLPESLDADNIEDSLDFSEEYFNKFAETISLNARQLKERNDTIDKLSGDIKSLTEQLSQATEVERSKQRQIDELSKKLQVIEEHKAIIDRRKMILKNLFILAFAILWKLLAVLIFVFLIRFFCKKNHLDFGTWLSVGIGIVGLVGTGCYVVKKDFAKYRQRIHPPPSAK